MSTEQMNSLVSDKAGLDSSAQRREASGISPFRKKPDYLAKEEKEFLMESLLPEQSVFKEAELSPVAKTLMTEFARRESKAGQQSPEPQIKESKYTHNLDLPQAELIELTPTKSEI